MPRLVPYLDNLLPKPLKFGHMYTISGDLKGRHGWPQFTPSKLVLLLSEWSFRYSFGLRWVKDQNEHSSSALRCNWRLTSWCILIYAWCWSHLDHYTNFLKRVCILIFLRKKKSYCSFVLWTFERRKPQKTNKSPLYCGNVAKITGHFPCPVLPFFWKFMRVSANVFFRIC